MNRKTLTLTLLLALVFIGLAGVRLTSPVVSHAPGQVTSQPDQSVELTLSFKVRIRLPLLKKDAN